MVVPGKERGQARLPDLELNEIESLVPVKDFRDRTTDSFEGLTGWEVDFAPALSLLNR
jgi:hypothetical protein